MNSSVPKEKRAVHCERRAFLLKLSVSINDDDGSVECFHVYEKAEEPITHDAQLEFNVDAGARCKWRLQSYVVIRKTRV